jgi:hypothetical protein
VKKTLLGVLIAAVTSIGSAALAQEPGWQPTGQPAPMPPPPPPPQAQTYTPDAYAAQTYAPPSYAAPAPVAPPAADGQWVYTIQYGWVWMPYGANYTYAPGGNVAYTYAYYPRFGWRWLSAPWVVNVGPSPFWGRLGPSHYAWYRSPAYRGHVAVGGWRERPMPVYRAAPAARVAVRFGNGHGYGRAGHRR